jgi:hypothetical protein
VKVIIAFVAAWLLLNLAVIVAVSMRRLHGWATYLVVATLLVGGAITIAIVLAP